MFRYVIFLISYGLCVIAITNCILYLNYRTLGYSWRAVLSYLINRPEIYVAGICLASMFIVVYDLIPSRSPSSSMFSKR